MKVSKEEGEEGGVTSGAECHAASRVNAFKPIARCYKLGPLGTISAKNCEAYKSMGAMEGLYGSECSVHVVTPGFWPHPNEQLNSTLSKTCRSYCQTLKLNRQLVFTDYPHDKVHNWLVFHINISINFG